MRQTILIIILFALIVMAAPAWSHDATVGKVHQDVLVLLNSDATYRTDVPLNAFSMTFRKDGVLVDTESVIYGNMSSGGYTLDWTPTLEGNFAGEVMVNNTTVAHWFEHVNARDVDDVFDNTTGLGDGCQPLIITPYEPNGDGEGVEFNGEWPFVRGDSAAIPFSFGEDLTGFTFRFAAKEDTDPDTAYAIAIKDITAYVTDFTTGTGTIPLTPAETDIEPGTYYAEVEAGNGTDVTTPLRFFLIISQDVVR